MGRFKNVGKTGTGRQQIKLVGIGLLTATVFAADVLTDLGVAVWIWYFIPLLASVTIGQRQLPFYMAGVISALLLAGYFFSHAVSTHPTAAAFSRLTVLCVNWLLALVLFWLQQTKEQLREWAELAELAHDAILVRDLDDRILYWNQSFERTIGWKAQEALGIEAAKLLKMDQHLFSEANKAVIEKGDWEGEPSYATKDGKTVTMDSRWTLLHDAAGRPKSILSINTDITEKQKLRQELLRTQRVESLGVLASGIAHDLNNILTPLMLSLALLRQKIKEPDTEILLSALEANVTRGAGIVKQVLTFGRGFKSERVATDPIRVIREIDRIVSETFPKSIQLRVQTPKDIWTVLGDPTQLHQVLLNLCLNSRDAMPKGGLLTISVENMVLDDIYSNMQQEAKPGPYVVISVTDTGTGIAPELQRQIFDPFFTTKDVGKGTGLGLSNVMAIVKSHGGFITFFSEVGKGTCINIHLPAKTADRSAETAHAAILQLPKGNNEQVLWVDDEESIRNVAKRVLERFGYRVLLAKNGAEAVSLYAQLRNEIAVVVTDMAMPIMDGLATIMALRNIDPHVKIVGSSGVANNDQEPGSSGVDDFILKPYTAETVLKALHNVLNGSSVSSHS